MVDLLGDDGLLDLRDKKRHTDPVAAVQDLVAEHDEAPAENDALRTWAPDHPERPDGVCHLCSAPPRLKCGACNQLACGKDSWIMLGLCRTCATEERMKLWHERNHTVSENWL
jgi:hypothetical protein